MRVKQLLNEKRSKITDRQFFTSRILAGHYEDLAAGQSVLEHKEPLRRLYGQQQHPHKRRASHLDEGAQA